MNIKIKPFFLAFLIASVGLSSCKEDEQATEYPSQLVLTEEIEVYDVSLIEDELVMVIQNGGTSAQLINKKGKILFDWQFEHNLGNDVELLPDGRVLGMFKSSNTSISFGGSGGLIQLIKPDLSVDWEYELATATQQAHHDVEMLPNGNVLFLVWEKISVSEAFQMGINVNHNVYLEKLVEVNPNTNEVVWEWRSKDHTVQDFNPSKPNFGTISENPERININYNLQSDGDLMHANGIDYDAEKDLIYMSVNYFSEVWVIDHSTTTEEASGNTGGYYNKGGDLVYRFGNPEAYNSNVGERLFDHNHFPNLIERGQPGNGNVLVFSNGNSTQHSTVFELQMPPSFDLPIDENSEPTVVWKFNNSMLSYGKLSGAVRLFNGNTLICEGDYGYWEVTVDGEIAWKYNGLAGDYWRGYSYSRNDAAVQNLGLEFE